MKIKKFWAMMIAAATLCGGFYSCSAEDEDAEPESTNSDPSNDTIKQPSDMSKIVEGSYDGELVITVGEQKITQNVTYTINKIDSSNVNIIIPSLTYMNFVIPSMNVNNMFLIYNVVDGKEMIFTYTPEYNGKMEVDGKEKTYCLSDFSFNFSDGVIKFKYAEKYGVMPVVLNCEFTGKK